MGAAIRAGAEYLPIRNLAGRLAAAAPPRDYMGQAGKIWDHVVTNWRYVRDPFGSEMVTTDPAALFGLVLGGDGLGAGGGRGIGDCDDIATASGAMLSSIGFPVRLATISGPNNPTGGWDHIFSQFNNAGRWHSFDPVLYPSLDMGDIAPYQRIGFWDLNGKQIHEREGSTMQIFDGCAFAGWEGDGRDLEDYQSIIAGFGCGVESMGYLNDPGVEVEIDSDDEIGGGYSVNPVIELSGPDFRRFQNSGPWSGLMGLGDEGSVYVYDGSLGRFKRLRRAAGKIRRRLKKAGKKLLSVAPGGKTLMRIGKRVMPIAKKVIRSASKLAPVAAFIPGVGPAAAIALKAAGRGVAVADKVRKGRKAVQAARRLVS